VGFAQHLDRVADGPPDRGQRFVAGVGEVQFVVARDDQQFVRGAAPVGADAHHVVVREENALALTDLRFDRGAQDATTLETAEGTLLFEQLARNEWEAEQLSVRVGDRCARLAAVVDDGLRVPDVRCGRVLEEAALQHQHHLAGIRVTDRVDAAVVVAGEHEHFVRAAGIGFDVNGPAVVDRERLFAVEGRVEVRDHPHLPGATLVDRLECRQRHLFVPGAERARPTGIGFDLGDARREVRRSLSTLGHDRDPPPGEWIETQLTHSKVQLRTSSWVQGGQGCELCDTPIRAVGCPW